MKILIRVFAFLVGLTISLSSYAYVPDGLNGRYWWLMTVSPKDITSAILDLDKAQCERAIEFLVIELGWERTKQKCFLQNPPPKKNSNNSGTIDNSIHEH